MANIDDIGGAVNRVRTILDRGNSPWMSNAEIEDFIFMATNEFIRERVDIFGATQRLRDDLGEYVKSDSVFVTSLDDDFFNWSRVRVDVTNVFDNFGYLLGIKIVPCSYLISDVAQFAITGEPALQDVNITELTEGHKNCKVISLDDAQVIADDPFNKPDLDNPRAVRVGDFYYILPGDELEDLIFLDNINGLGYMFKIYFDFVSDNDDDGDTNIDNLPIHSREEVCQIAARRILGTTADERYQIGDAEIRQLNK